MTDWDRRVRKRPAAHGVLVKGRSLRDPKGISNGIEGGRGRTLDYNIVRSSAAVANPDLRWAQPRGVDGRKLRRRENDRRRRSSAAGEARNGKQKNGE